MRNLPTSMNNRRPAGSSDSEWEESTATYAHNPGRPRDRAVPLRNPPPNRNPGPPLSGAAFGAEPDYKPSQD